MLEKISVLIAEVFIKHSIIKEEEKSVYAYGTELLLSVFLNIIIALIISIITHKVVETFIFTVSFISVRQYIGGYHADTHLKCMITFTATILAFISAVSITPSDIMIPLIVLSVLFSAVSILIFSPVEHKNKPLEQELKIRLRKRSILSLCVVCFLITVICFLNFRLYGFCISLGLVTAVIAMLAEIIISRKK